MKTRIVVATLIIISGALLFVGVNEYQASQARAKAAEVAANDAFLSSVEARAAAEKTLITKYNVLYAECEKGATNYLLMTTAEKAKAQVVNCGVSIVE